jgi:hypothetical protein
VYASVCACTSQTFRSKIYANLTGGYGVHLPTKNDAKKTIFFFHFSIVQVSTVRMNDNNGLIFFLLDITLCFSPVFFIVSSPRLGIDEFNDLLVVIRILNEEMKLPME